MLHQRIKSTTLFLAAALCGVASLNLKPQDVSNNPDLSLAPDSTYLETDAFAASEATHKDIRYKSIRGSPLMLDIHMPTEVGLEEQNKKIPAVIYLHPGAWISGSKSQINGQAMKLLSEGIAIVSIDYRLATEENKWGGQHKVVWPAQGEDVRDAVEWVKKHGSKYGIDPHHLGCWGESSGGQLCAWLASAGAMHTATKVNVAVVMFGPTCIMCWPYLTELAGSHPADWLFGFESGRLGELVGRMDNVTHAEEKDVKLVESAEAVWQVLEVSKGHTTPTFIGHGRKDTLVPPEKADFLKKALSKYHVDHKVVMVDNGRHMYEGWNDEPIDQAIAFVKKHIL